MALDAETRQQLIDTVRRFVSERCVPIEAQVAELRQVDDDGSVAGYVWIEVRERTLHVHALLLEEEFRGRGLGGRTPRPAPAAG